MIGVIRTCQSEWVEKFKALKEYSSKHKGRQNDFCGIVVNFLVGDKTTKMMECTKSNNLGEL